MPDSVFAILAVLALLLFSGVGLILLVKPSLHAHVFSHPRFPDTPWNRIQMRALGLVICVFLLMMLSGGSPIDAKTGILERFHRNMLIALWASFFAAPMLCLVVWKVSILLVRRGYVSGTFDDNTWERGVSATFCSVLILIVVAALALETNRHHR
jgi:hypothetical protein